MREGRTAAQVQHPHIVDVFDFGVENGVPFLVMELVDGETLAQLLERERSLPLERIAETIEIARRVGGGRASRSRHRAPRSEAGERLAPARPYRRHGAEGGGLRCVPHERRVAGSNRLGRRARNAGVHVAGAGAREPRSDRADRSVCAGRDPVRMRDGRRAVQGRCALQRTPRHRDRALAGAKHAFSRGFPRRSTPSCCAP